MLGLNGYFKIFILLSALSVLSNGCTCSRQEPVTKTTEAEGEAARATVSPTPTLEKLGIKDIVVGTGTAVKSGAKVSGVYGIWIYEPLKLGSKGKLIAMSETTEGVPDYSFTVCKGEVIKGWEDGVLEMQVGGQRQILVPVSMAYGAKGNDVVPPNSMLLIEFVLNKIQ